MLLVALSIATATAQFFASSRLHAITVCQTAANQRFADTLGALADANAAADAAQLVFLRVLVARAAPADIAAATRTYELAVEARVAAHVANPLTIQDCTQAGR